MKGKTPTKKEKAWMDAISDLGCIVCRNEGFGQKTPASVHHLVVSGRRLGHMYTIPLCFNHHQAGLDDEVATSRHPYKAEFERRYGTEWQLLDQCKRLVARNGELLFGGF